MAMSLRKAVQPSVRQKPVKATPDGSVDNMPNDQRERLRNTAVLETLTKHELIQHIEDLREEAEMTRAFSHVAETGTNDATLLWQGRNRFLSEKIIPVTLKPIVAESLNPEKSRNRIIDGDNLAVMASLLTDFRGGPTRGFDVIYMDPPYNTGGDVFSYNDDYRLSKTEVKTLRRVNGRSETLVSLDDPTRHTKWINHMAPRLWAAKKLLKSTGVIIISIDEHELPRLWMLMEEIFSEKNRLATIIWERSRKNDAAYVSEGHEYMLVWSKNKAELDSKRSKMGQLSTWQQTGGRWRKKKDGVDGILTAYAEAKKLYGDDVAKIQTSLNAFFAGLPKGHPSKLIRYKKVNQYGVYNDDGNLNWPGGGGPRYNLMHPKTGKPCKEPASGWRYQEPEMKNLVAEGRIAFKADHKGVPRYITYLHEMETEVQTSVISRSGQRSVETLESILGKDKFKNPKDPEILAELFNLVTWEEKNAIILDPYAGSGTTAHAVLSMNAEDDGNRSFVLIEGGDPSSKSTIPRSKYVSEITAERVRRLITGKWADKKEHAGHDTGFHFFRASEQITKTAIMAATRETLADIILQIVEDESNRIDCRVEGHRFLIGRTKLGFGIALVWQPSQNKKSEQVLSWGVLEAILDEAEKANVTKPVHIYATANTAPLSDELYRFHQIPNSILARLGLLDGDEETGL
jgi:adenine-specific DNA-methyltransferase